MPSNINTSPWDSSDIQSRWTWTSHWTAFLHHEQSSFDGAYDDGTTRKIRVYTPSSIELSTVTWRENIEKSYFCKVSWGDSTYVQYSKSSSIVGLIRLCSLYIKVVIDGSNTAIVKPNEKRSIQVLDVPYVGPRFMTLLCLIQLIIHEIVAMIFSGPTLVGIRTSSISNSGDLSCIGLIGHIDNRERILVRSEDDFTTLIIKVRSYVIDRLCIMCVSILRKTSPATYWRCRILDIHEMKSPWLGIATNRIGKSRILIDDDVMGFSKARIMSIFSEDHRRSNNIP